MIFSVFQKYWVFGYFWSTRKPRLPMDKRPLVEGRIANFGIFLDVFEFLCFGYFFPFFKKFWFLGILGPPYCSIGATIRIGREMLCLPYEGLFFLILIFAILAIYSLTRNFQLFQFWSLTEETMHITRTVQLID